MVNDFILFRWVELLCVYVCCVAGYDVADDACAVCATFSHESDYD